MVRTTYLHTGLAPPAISYPGASVPGFFYGLRETVTSTSDNFVPFLPFTLFVYDKNARPIRIGDYVLIAFLAESEKLLGTVLAIRRSRDGVRYDVELRLNEKPDGGFDNTRIDNIESRFVTKA